MPIGVPGYTSDSRYRSVVENAAGIGERIKELRRAKGMSIGQLAFKSGVSENAVRKVENGENKAPSFVTGVRIARALGVDPWLIAFGEGAASNVIPLHEEPSQPNANERLEAVEQRLDDLTRLLHTMATSAAAAAEVAAKTQSPPRSVGKRGRE